MKTKLLISGRVQGVGYRFWSRQTAEELGLEIKVQNLDNGQVKAILKGDKIAIKEFIKKAHSGPPLARVEDIKITNLD